MKFYTIILLVLCWIALIDFATAKDYSKIKQAIQESAEKVKVPYYILSKIADIESRFNPSAINPIKGSTAKGLFQIIDKSANRLRKRYKIKGSIFNSKTNSLMAAYMLKQNVEYLQKKLGRYFEMTPSYYYLTHFLGNYKAYKFIRTKGSNLGYKVFPKEARANKGIFYFRNGKPKTIRQIRQFFILKMKKARIL